MSVSFEEKINYLLGNAGLSQSELAGILNVSRATINSWIKGRYRPSSRRLRNMSNFFRIKLEWFLDDQCALPPAPDYQISPEINNKPEIQATNMTGVKTVIERVDENLFQINDPEVQEVFSQIRDSIQDRDSNRISKLCEKLQCVLNLGLGNKPIVYKAFKRNGSGNSEGEQKCNLQP